MSTILSTTGHGKGRPLLRHSILRQGVLLTLLALYGAALAGCGSAHRTANSGEVPTPKHSASGGLYGLVPEPMPRKPNFTLTDTSRHPFSLAMATRGKLTYLYFGYTHCPDACPATMSDISAALRLQPASIRRQIAVVFVTVDPRRDTLAVLRTWLNHYGTSFVGLRGNPNQIAAAEEAAGVPPSPPQTEASGNYSVPHSSVLFAYSPDNRAHVIYSQGFTPAEYAHDMPLLLRFKT
jgi:protein SCO1/2